HALRGALEALLIELRAVERRLGPAHAALVVQDHVVMAEDRSDEDGLCARGLPPLVAWPALEVDRRIGGALPIGALADVDGEANRGATRPGVSLRDDDVPAARHGLLARRGGLEARQIARSGWMAETRARRQQRANQQPARQHEHQVRHAT